VLEPLTQKYKNDAAVTRLYDHVQTERKVHAQRVRMEKELAALKKLVSEEKFAEAVTKGEPLIQEFNEEPEFSRVVDYARSQKSQSDKQSKIKSAIQQAEELLAKGSFAEAAAAADKALDSFPGNMDLKAILDDARNKQKEKEKKEYVEKQIRSIKASIEQGNHTAAMDMARQTLSVAKNNPELTSLLQYAEKEREGRDAKKSQDQQLQTIVGLAMKQKFDEADQALKNAEKTSIINPLDPRWQELMRAVKEKRTPAEEVVTAKSPEAVPSGTVVAPGQYVFSHGKPVVEPEATPVGPQANLQHTMVQPAAVPVPPPAPPAAPPKVEPPKAEPYKPEAKPVIEEPPSRKKEEKKKAKPAVEEPKREEPKKKEEKPFSATMVQAPAAKPEARPEPRVAPRPEPPRAEPPRSAPAPMVAEEKKSPMMMIGIIAVVVIVLGVGAYMYMGKGGSTGGGNTSGLSTEQKTILQDADKLYGEHKLGDALAKYKQLPAEAAPAKITEIEKTLADEKTAYDAGQNALKVKNYTGAMENFKKAVDLNGDLKAQAEAALKNAQNLAAGADPKKIEADTYQRASNAMKRKEWATAAALLQEVIGMDLANKGKAQTDLQTAQARVLEQKTFEEGRAAEAAGQKDAAKQKFQQVVQMNGPLRADANTQIQIIDGALGEEKARGELTTRADALIAGGQYREARALFAQIQQMKGDTSALEGKITQGEQQAFSALRTKFEAARGSKNESQLKDLQSQARAMGSSGGSQAANAQQLADREIADALKVIEADRVTAANANAAAAAQREKTNFDNAVAAFNSAAKDPAALRGPVTRQFQAIVSSGSSYATQASDYLNSKIPEAAKAARPCPIFAVLAAGAAGMTQVYKAGDTVPAGLLDAKPTWTTCSWPDLPAGTNVMLSLSVDENGTPTDVKSRGTPPGANLDAAIAAVKQWKASGPKHKGLAVKTTTALDIKGTP